jgi:succinate-acetate transporter protein
MSQPAYEPERWGEVGAASLYAVAIVTLCLGAFWSGFVSAQAAILLIPPMVAASLTPFVCGVIDFKRGNIIPATLGLVFGGMLGFGGIAQTALYAWTAVNNVPIDPRLSGYMWLAAGIILILIGLVSMRLTWAFFLFLVLVGLGLVFNSVAYVWGIAPAVLVPLSGWLVILFSIWCLYAATAILLNTQARKMIMPLGTPIVK